MCYIVINKSTSTDIKNHLTECDLHFEPNLSSYVDISKYARKLEKKSYRIELWDNNNNLIGLLASYLNEQSKSIFISNISIIQKYHGLRLASKMFDRLLQEAIENNYTKITLEVYNSNNKAIRFYTKIGFVISTKINRLKSLYIYNIK